MKLRETLLATKATKAKGISDIEDIAENGDFEKILKSYGEDAIEKIVESIKKKANNLKTGLMLSVVGFLVWGYGGFIMISQSVTKAAGF